MALLFCNFHSYRSIYLGNSKNPKLSDQKETKARIPNSGTPVSKYEVAIRPALHF